MQILHLVEPITDLVGYALIALLIVAVWAWVSLKVFGG